MFPCRSDYIITPKRRALRFHPLECTLFRDSRCTYQDVVMQAKMIACRQQHKVVELIVIWVLIYVVNMPPTWDGCEAQGFTHYNMVLEHMLAALAACVPVRLEHH